MGEAVGAWLGQNLSKILHDQNFAITIGKPQTPPDLVVKSQAIDIIATILRLVLRLRVMYQREIKG